MSLTIGLSYYLGFSSGINKNCKKEVRQFLLDMTRDKMLHQYFQNNAMNETKLFLKFLGVKNPKVKKQKLMTPEEFDSENKK
jgi:hypothetical protein